MRPYFLSQLEELEAEGIFVIREVAAQFENPAILFSGGKDSLVVLHLAIKAFYPAKIPFQIVHIDSGHNFPETIQFRDYVINKFGLNLIVGSVEKSILQGRVTEETGLHANRNQLQTTTLLDTIESFGFDACIGGARRDEEKARAKERFFSHRDEFGQWDPKNQRPELWSIFNGHHRQGEHFRVFPLNNWTELDVWQYIKRENIELPSLYFSHQRECVERQGMLLPISEFLELKETEKPSIKQIRFRTLGDITITGAWESEAINLDQIIDEIASSRITERGGRADDKKSQSSMEDRKKEGYF